MFYLHKENVVALVGPTGVGKTSLSINLAKRINAEIISTDSMQIYKHMDIGTAKITKDEMCGVTHHMIDIVSPFVNYSLYNYLKDAKKCAEDIFKRGKNVLLVGGSGLYVDSFIKNVEFKEETKAPKIREDLNKLLLEKGKDELFNLLIKEDKKASEKIHPNNTKRVIRALEYFYETGESITDKKDEGSIYNYVYINLQRDREVLYERIDKRVDEMIKKGLLFEVWHLYKMGLRKTHSSMQALGYKEYVKYLEGKLSLFECEKIIKRDTRHFAKRQLTWYRNKENINNINLDNYKNEDEVLQDILKILTKKGVIK